MELVKKYFPGLSSLQLEQLAALKPLYAEWNTKINVISRKDIDNFYEHHVLHSLAIAARFVLQENDHVLDIGTGGGFPGIPLAIFFPLVNFHMVDSIQKKLQVINSISGTIGLLNTSTQHTRAEEIKDRKFDMIVSRAVAPLKELWKWSKPLLNPPIKPIVKIHKSGLICLKGGQLQNEILASGTHPQQWDIHQFFNENFFREKYLLYITG